VLRRALVMMKAVPAAAAHCDATRTEHLWQQQQQQRQQQQQYYSTL
jgi:hypothetical protein